MSDPVDDKINNLHALRADVAETTNVLKVTVDKLVDRGDRLDALSARAEDLNSSSYHFHGSARRVQRSMKWRNYKITIFIVAVVIIVVGIIVLIAVHPWKK
ncbi:unnamed protein product [Rotaria sp. Silwood2]|nr:unnamed protein product [Rotaria sp. Silwood2]CAF2803115.1 unnamed protein product [Rotaria sp. Silwood2]CAF2991098.1 unnamed protein product [Rotaria sp. Silwood2]CAF3163620.1 unnamed protein product [Rotaria sp. Silwood2]CAF3907996.1 unnamed protein product [Rotaria sp. Silwood2]